MKAETGLKEKWLGTSSFFSSSPPFCEQDIHTPQLFQKNNQFPFCSKSGIPFSLKCWHSVRIGSPLLAMTGTEQFNY